MTIHRSRRPFNGPASHQLTLSLIELAKVLPTHAEGGVSDDSVLNAVCLDYYWDPSKNLLDFCWDLTVTDGIFVIQHRHRPVGDDGVWHDSPPGHERRRFLLDLSFPSWASALRSIIRVKDPQLVAFTPLHEGDPCPTFRSPTGSVVIPVWKPTKPGLGTTDYPNIPGEKLFAPTNEQMPRRVALNARHLARMEQAVGSALVLDHCFSGLAVAFHPLNGGLHDATRTRGLIVEITLPS